MQRDPRAWLWDVQQAARRIDRFQLGHDLSSYQADDMVRSAVERQFEVIGEALAQLAKHAPDIAGAVPHWREAIGFRNVLIHGYAKVDEVRVWHVAQLNLPAMAREVDRLLNEAGEGHP